MLALALLPSCLGTSLADRERRTREEFALASLDLSPSTVSLHDEVEYRSPSLENSCGITCLDMILAHEQRALPLQVRDHLRQRIDEDAEVDNGDLVDALGAAGLLAIHLQGTLAWPEAPEDPPPGSWENPLVHVHAGQPVILRILTPSEKFHYVLLLGYDPQHQRVIVVNPGYGKQVWPERSLLHWVAADRWFVAYKRAEDDAR